MSSYDAFIGAKSRIVPDAGFEPYPFLAPLMAWQQFVTAWAIRRGRAALWEDCGLGKTIQQLEWARQVVEHSKAPVLILTPLAVSAQTASEARKFGIAVTVVQSGEQVTDAAIYITNYEKLDHFDCSVFAGVVLDESSILKSFDGKLRRKITAAFKDTPYRLCCTATPSPNDYTELGQHAEFLGICTPSQMLATFFINDTFNTGDWRLKGHAEGEFWKWMASWAACISKPSDIGFSDEGYALPGLEFNTVIVDVDESQCSGDGLFRFAQLSATSMHRELRQTSADRAAKVAELVAAEPDEPWMIWCYTNDEADHLMRLIPSAVEIRGNETNAAKERKIMAWLNGEYLHLITKPSICGYGLNAQHCARTAFVGLSYSFEDFYQALRRMFRFGQSRIVKAYLVQAHTEGAILQTILHKMEQHKVMQESMKQAAHAFAENRIKELTARTEVDALSGADWTVYHGDCVRVAKMLPSESIDFAVFSPPFADLFTYSDDLQDMGNCSDLTQFTEHFEFLIAELRRVMVPGREVAVHCVDLLSTKWKTGKVQFQDFSGEIIRAFWRHGFSFHSRICIWKSPVTEMQRTKAHGLLYKTLKSDSTNSRVGSADYLLVFKAPGENPRPVTKDPSEFPVDWWQEVASPVWMTVDQCRVLNGEGSREHADEKHICPLQLDVIDRAVTLWTNPGDLVYSPFAGIGSEGYGALKLGRRFVGSELKESYFQQAAQNLKMARAQMGLFS